MKIFITTLLALLIICYSVNLDAQQPTPAPNSINLLIGTEDGLITLYWKTPKEINTSYFLIEQSADSLLFSPFATKKAAGSSLSARNYAADVFNDAVAKTYYRVTLVLMDGGRVSSPVVLCPAGQAVTLSQNKASK